MFIFKRRICTFVCIIFFCCAFVNGSTPDETTISSKILSNQQILSSTGNHAGTFTDDYERDLLNPNNSVIICTVTRDEKNPNIIDKTSGDRFSDLFIKTGNVQSTNFIVQPNCYPCNEVPRIEMVDENGEIVFATNFEYQTVMTVPMAVPGEGEDSVPAVVSIPPITTLVLPYLEDAKSIRIISEGNQVSDLISLDKVSIQGLEKGSLQVDPAPVKPGSFNLLILASGYNAQNMGNFLNHATSIEGIIRDSEPFKSRNASVSISYSTNLENLGCHSGCNGIDRLLCCNTTKVISAAFSSGLLFDEIIVVHNTDTYSGGGYRDSGAYKTNSYSSYCAVYNGSYATKMALHEFGHSFGDLCDEYSYTSEGYTYTPCVNCRASCADWNSFAEGCQKGCDARSDYYRPEDSIMIGYDVPRFNNASLKAGYSPDGLNKRADFFIVSPVPAANFRSNVTSGMVPLTVLFTDTSTNNPNSWNWQFGDGDTSEVQHPVHTYSVAGLYTVNLTVSNSAGSSSKVAPDYINATGSGPVLPEANFSANVTYGQIPLSVQFTDMSTGSPTMWSWEFGDGGTSPVQHPVHIFSVAGLYSVNLTVSNSAGSSSKGMPGLIHAVLPTINHVISASAGAGGSITPSGEVLVPDGGNQTFTFVADTGYRINNLTVDGLLTHNGSPYTFTNVTRNHTIAVDFITQPGPENPWEIKYANRFTDQWSPERGYGWRSDIGEDWSYQIGPDSGDSEYTGPTDFYTLTGFITSADRGIFLNQKNATVNLSLQDGEAFTSTRNFSHMIEVKSGTVVLNTGILNTTTDVRSNFASGIELTGDNGTAYMNGGMISGYYDGIILRNGTAVMNDGFIQAECGIHVLNGNATMYNGDVAGYEGMRMYDGSITVHGGSLSGRDGVIMWGGNLTVRDGTIRGTSQAINSYGINVMGGSLLITGGDIRGQSGITVKEVAPATDPNILIQSPTRINGSYYGIQFGESVANSPNASFWKTVLSDPSIVSGSLSKIHVEAYSPDNSIAYPGVIISTGDGINPVYPVSVDLSKISGTATSLSDIRIYDETDNLCFDGTVNTTKITMPKWDGNEADPFTFTSSSFELFRIEKTQVSNYVISASATEGGSIEPSGYVSVTKGGNQTFSITSDAEYLIADVVVDGLSMGPLSWYTFDNVVSNHTILASFNPVPSGTYMINSSANNWSVIVPRGNNSYPEYTNQSFITQAKPGSSLTDVQVDNASVGAVTSWTFTNLSADHTIHVDSNPKSGQILVAFDASPRTGTVPLTVHFVDQSLGIPTSWYWQYGDGTSDSSQNPTHTYSSPGTYSVSLRAMNGQTGGMGQWNGFITVTN